MSSSYITYQCSICRRKKDVLRDDVRAFANHCIITKGCEGRLFKVGEKSIPDIVSTVSGLTDWYPRGQTPSIKAEVVAPSPIRLSCSSTGVVTLAIYQSDVDAAANQVLKMKLTQRRVEDISSVQYLFRPITSVTVVSGKDSTGKNMRFDQTAIDEGRVFVRVNGIPRFQGAEADELVLTPNTITFNTAIDALSTVSVSVSQEKNTVERVLSFNLNASNAVSTNSGSWGNVRWVREYDVTTKQLKPLKWWIYSCPLITTIAASSTLRLDGIYKEDETTPVLLDTNLDKARFLLAASPYENTDRYINFMIPATEMHADFMLSASKESVLELFADASAFTEVYPPLQLINPSSYTSADVFTTTTTVPDDTASVRFTGERVLGPL
jgi:hypothetical protein